MNSPRVVERVTPRKQAIPFDQHQSARDIVRKVLVADDLPGAAEGMDTAEPVERVTADRGGRAAGDEHQRPRYALPGPCRTRRDHGRAAKRMDAAISIEHAARRRIARRRWRHHAPAPPAPSA